MAWYVDSSRLQCGLWSLMVCTVLERYGRSPDTVHALLGCTDDRRCGLRGLPSSVL